MLFLMLLALKYLLLFEYAGGAQLADILLACIAFIIYEDNLSIPSSLHASLLDGSVSKFW